MKFDSSLSQTSKLHLLADLLKKDLASQEAKAAPQHVWQTDLVTWKRLMTARFSIAHELNDQDEEESIAMELIERNDDKSDKLALHLLAGLREQQGRYAEAEGMLKEVLPWMVGHELLGEDSPQALSVRRRLIKCAWKQGKKEEVREMTEKTSVLVEEMGGGKFACYQEDERKYLAEMVSQV